MGQRRNYSDVKSHPERSISPLAADGDGKMDAAPHGRHKKLKVALAFIGLLLLAGFVYWLIKALQERSKKTTPSAAAPVVVPPVVIVPVVQPLGSPTQIIFSQWPDLAVQWNVVESATFYQLKYKIGTAGSDAAVIRVDADTRAFPLLQIYVFSDAFKLFPLDTPVTFTVEAFNANNSGPPFSATFTQPTPASVPAAITNWSFSNFPDILVTWDGGDGATTFDFTFTDDTSTVHTVTTTDKSVSLAAVVRSLGLAAIGYDTPVYCTLQAFNGKGGGSKLETTYVHETPAIPALDFSVDASTGRVLFSTATRLPQHDGSENPQLMLWWTGSSLNSDIEEPLANVDWSLALYYTTTASALASALLSRGVTSGQSVQFLLQMLWVGAEQSVTTNWTSTSFTVP